MKPVNAKHNFQRKLPSDDLVDYVEMFFENKNESSEANNVSIFPDSFFKIIIQLVDGKVTAFFMTGLWITEVNIVSPPNSTYIGIKFKALAPEYIFNQSISSFFESFIDLDTSFWDIEKLDFSNFDNVVNVLEDRIRTSLKENSPVVGKRLALSQLLYKMNGNITVEEVSNQVHWSTSQINRYLNKYIGVSLKTYLNIQRCYNSYTHIVEGKFYPEEGFYDQPHFIREIKKHTNYTPKELHAERDARFIQLKHIRT